MAKQALPADALYRVCDPSQFDFETTKDLAEISSLERQPRARDAIELGARMKQKGFNLYVATPSGLDTEAAVVAHLKTLIPDDREVFDWVYVNDFEDGQKPYPIALKPGKGAGFRDAVAGFVAELLDALDDVLSADDFVHRRKEIERLFTRERELALDKLRDQVRPHGLILAFTEAGIQAVPGDSEGPAEPDVLASLGVEEKTRLAEVAHGFDGQARQLEKHLGLLDQERLQALAALARATAEPVIEATLKSLRGDFSGGQQALDYIERVRQDVIRTVPGLIARSRSRSLANAFGYTMARRYSLNLFVEADRNGNPPIIRIEKPTARELFGEVEAEPDPVRRQTVEDCHALRPGAFHAAQGGYLIVNLFDLLDADSPLFPAVLETLKSGKINVGMEDGLWKIISGGEEFQPRGLPLQAKVVLVGGFLAYRMLRLLMPDFRELFKVLAEFDDRFARDPEHDRHYAHLLASLARRQNLRPLTRTAVARVIEHSSRLFGDGERVFLYMDPLLDVLNEADHYAARDDAAAIDAAHISRAVNQADVRNSRVPGLARDFVLRDNRMIATDGARIGQVNGLFVHTIGGRSVGEPSRVSARVRVGSGEVLQIDREADLSFEIHSKGAKIMESYLKSNYAPNVPFCLDAGIAFEQSYAYIDGDSASSTELYALLSAISEVPIKQCFAVTGSVNQFGEVQTIGAVNEKIEGFFDVCAARGLTGRQGVLIPRGNVKNLMLRRDVVDAVGDRKFSIYAVSTIDEGLEILTGQRAGRRTWNGRYPRGTINRKVEDRLIGFARAARAHNAPLRRSWWW